MLSLETFTTKKSLLLYLTRVKASGKTVGLVPTMGALHHGHISLIEQAKQIDDVVICSVFVNPTQFTDPKDLEKYPRTIEADVIMLEEVGCSVLFNPTVSEIYDGDEQWHLNIGELEHLLEGKFRPGHYQGVMQVVNKLFDIVTPDTALFGQKDYQQYLVISKMVQLLNMPVKLVMCAIKREPDGLAMSSRNIHLTPYDHEHALVLSRALKDAKTYFDSNDLPGLEAKAQEMIQTEPGVELEYFKIADGETLYPASNKSEKIIALVAARVGKTRLIDNMILK